MSNLLEIYQNHNGKNSDKWSQYIHEYQRLFNEYRNKSIRLLEIGIQNGGSLEIWMKYFNNAEKLVGCDINPNCAKLEYDSSKIAVVVGDANSETSEAEILQHSNNFDIIIDDGSHLSKDVIKSFSRYFPHLNENGIYIVEDLHCSYWQEYQGGLYYPYSPMAFFQRLSDIINHQHWGINRERKKVLEGFSNEHSTTFDNNTLKEIHSVEFYNSLCIIKKHTKTNNSLGTRLTVGEDYQTAPIDASNSEPIILPQHQNQWSTMQEAPSESWQALTQNIATQAAQIDSLNNNILEQNQNISELTQNISELTQNIAIRDAQIDSLNNEINSLVNSKRWRLTTPLRNANYLLKKLLNGISKQDK